jgi:hypothetical protein
MSKPLQRFLCSIALLVSCGLTRGATNEQWLACAGGDGPGKGRHIVLIAADQEYRSEHSMPMMAKILSTHHGFDCTVLFAVNDQGEVDPTMPVYPEKGKPFKEHHIPGLEHLASADLVIFFPRLLTLPMRERELIVKFIDSGRPIISIRTGNHGFHAALPYKINGKQVRWGEDVLGGTFLGHHGRWHADSTRGIIVPEQKDHPVLISLSRNCIPRKPFSMPQIQAQGKASLSAPTTDESSPAAATRRLRCRTETLRTPSQSVPDRLQRQK